MAIHLRPMPELERVLLRRGVNHMAEESEVCGQCRRHPLIGERVYVYKTGATLCELCRAVSPEVPASSHLVHGPEFGHTMRIIDQRPSG